MLRFVRLAAPAFICLALIIAVGLGLSTDTAKAGAQAQNNQCSLQNKVARGSYLWDPQLPEFGRIYYEVRYNVQSDCSVYIQDVRSRYVGPGVSEISIVWVSVCSAFGCLPVNKTLDGYRTGAWTGRESVGRYVPFNSEFRHVGGYRADRPISYGYTYLN